MSVRFTLNFSGATYQFVNNYYIITFPNNNTTGTNATGSITFLTNVNNASIICVAGGGGGGSGSSTSGGGGGGGGGNYQVQQTLSGGTYNITVGYGGGRNSNGSPSTVISSSGTSIISSTGGQSGNPIFTGGKGGSGGSSTPGNGNGGNGASTNFNTPTSRANDSWGTITIPNQLSTIIANRYGGGGGAGWSSTSGISFSGLAGNMGIGGSYSQGTNGQSATSSSFGSGGGGAAPSSNPGRGANGIVIIYFPYGNYYRIQNNLIYTLFFPVGSIVAYIGRETVSSPNYDPDGWLVCDGRTIGGTILYNTKYDDLINFLGGTNNTVTLPNLNAAFLRGAGAYDGNHVGPSLKNFQVDAYKTHTHRMLFDSFGRGEQGRSNSMISNGNSIVNTKNTYEGGSNTGTQGTGVSSGGTNVDTNDTRPNNYGVKWLIKY